ncbi:MAG: nickel/dipeptide/oligopeptide ABC transporter substrate-binding protein [SAR324 cluster bacterium]|uniref:Nickel/dipeptide/oligopeptide ABC transporter substrate-binding protein n=1 Tax=SAR324 cluster bacterium TaxID=2024889 RepID=A0A2A4TAC3_9DELT|nr:MAG: nickel/dipeptide/oligopeptide ABC transporter substrate-binding protein [SAR324 cluster bacterium]
MIKKGLIFVLFSFCCLLSTVGAQTLRVTLESIPQARGWSMSTSGGELVYSQWVFDSLVQRGEQQKIEPRLAIKWEQVSPTTLRFHLRKDVVFHSGNAFTAKDVAWTLEKLKESASRGQGFDSLQAKVLDDHTIELSSNTESGLLLNLAAYLYPADRRFYEKAQAAEKSQEALLESGTGKYQVTQRQDEKKVVMEVFSEHWDQKVKGNVQKIIITSIAQGDLRVEALLAGKTDLISSIPLKEHKRLRRSRRVKLFSADSNQVVSLQINQTRNESLRDLRVRLAIAFAIRNHGLVKQVLVGAAKAATQYPPKGSIDYNPKLRSRYSLKRASRYLKQAGLDQGFALDMIAADDNQEIAQKIVTMLGKVKIKVNLKIIPRQSYLEQFLLKQADLQMISWAPQAENAADYYQAMLLTPNADKQLGKYNSGNYSNPILDAVVLASSSEVDPLRRIKLLQAAAKIAYDDVAFVPLYWKKDSWAAKRTLKLSPLMNQQNLPVLSKLVLK